MKLSLYPCVRFHRRKGYWGKRATVEVTEVKPINLINPWYPKSGKVVTVFFCRECQVERVEERELKPVAVPTNGKGREYIQQGPPK